MALLALAGAALLATGCGDSGGSPPGGGSVPGASTSTATGPTADAVTINMITPPHTLDPGDQCNLADGLAGNVYSRLIAFGSKPGPDGTTQTDQTKLVGDLAERWDVSKDGTVYTFHLRPDATFSDGDPVDAKAVVYSFNRVVKMGVCSSYGVDTSDTGVVESIKAVDDHTVRFKLKTPNPSLLSSWATPSLGIVNPKVVEANGGIVAGKPNEYLATHAVGSGPYTVESYQPNQRLVLAANPTYYGTKPKTKRITVNFVSSPTTLQLQAKDGTADVTFGLPKQSLASLKGGSNRVLDYAGTGTEQVVMNWKKAPFDNQKFREALLAAIPYDELVKKVAFGYGSTFYGPLLPSMPFFNADGSRAVPYDVAHAKELLAQSGVTNPSITLTSDSGNQVHNQLATVLKAAWEQIGVKTTVQELDQAAYTDALFGNTAQAVLRRDGPFVNNPAYYLGYDMSCKVGGNPNPGNICIPAADKLLQAATRSDSKPDQQRDYDEITTLWRAQTPKAFLYLDKEVVVAAPAVTGFQFDVGYGGLAALAKQGG